MKKLPYDGTTYEIIEEVLHDRYINLLEEKFNIQMTPEIVSYLMGTFFDTVYDFMKGELTVIVIPYLGFFYIKDGKKDYIKLNDARHRGEIDNGEFNRLKITLYKTIYTPEEQERIKNKKDAISFRQEYKRFAQKRWRNDLRIKHSNSTKEKQRSRKHKTIRKREF